MPTKLSTLESKIQSVQNPANAKLLREFVHYMKETGASERHQGNELLVMLYLASHLGKKRFRDVKSRKQIVEFLDLKRKPKEQDPDERWITTWNDYLGSIKHFYRWLYNQKGKRDLISPTEWKTPRFLQIKKIRTKRLSPYSETEIWDLDELLTIVRYEPNARNKAALTLFWDLDARNHEVTLLKNKNVRLRDRYGEGEVPFEAKTGSGPILLIASFPYVRDWQNLHPARDNPEAFLICNLMNGGPVRPDAMWRMMKQLRKRIVRLLKSGEIADPAEREKLAFLLKTKKWTPYVLRHSAITADADFLPEFALRKKVRWSMNSKQPARYIKRRMGDELRKTILAHHGVLSEDEIKHRPTISDCPRCGYVNSGNDKYCSKCSYPLSQLALQELKTGDRQTIDSMQEQLTLMKEESDKRFMTILSWLQQNPALVNVKPEELLNLRARRI